MKHILFSIFIFCAVISDAQNPELLKIYDQIDKIIENERQYYYEQTENNSDQIKQLKGYPYLYKPVYKFGKLVRQPLNREYEKQVLKYLEKFKYDKMLNIRKTVYQLIYSVGFYSEDLKIRQRALNDLLDMAFAVFESRGETVEDFKAEDFDKKAKKRLQEIILGKMTKKDIQFYSDYVKRLMQPEGFKKQAEFLSKRDSLPYQQVLDSLVDAVVKNNIKSYIDEQVYGDYHILLTGRLYMYDFVPELEELLKNEKYKNEKENIKYALARMGNEKYEQELLKKKNTRIRYINTQNSIWKIIKKLYENPPDHNCEPNYEEYHIELSDVLVPKKYFIISWVQGWILNFPEEYKLPRRIDICMKRHDFQAGKYEEQVEKAKKWLLENKGKYELDPEVW